MSPESRNKAAYSLTGPQNSGSKSFHPYKGIKTEICKPFSNLRLAAKEFPKVEAPSLCVKLLNASKSGSKLREFEAVLDAHHRLQRLQSVENLPKKRVSPFRPKP
jgi:hypothetical protein